MPTSQFPEEGILWRDWSDETLRAIEEKKWPVLLFVADPEPTVWPFLREIFKEMPANARLRVLLHEFYPAVFIQADALRANGRVWRGRAASSLAKPRIARARKQSYREPNARTEDGLGAHSRR